MRGREEWGIGTKKGKKSAFPVEHILLMRVSSMAESAKRHVNAEESWSPHGDKVWAQHSGSIVWFHVWQGTSLSSSFVDCKECGRKMHQICVLHYDIIWPSGWVTSWWFPETPGKGEHSTQSGGEGTGGCCASLTSPARIQQLEGWLLVLNLSLKCLCALGIVESKQSASSLLYNDVM